MFYPPQELCTDNGAMIALAAALRLQNSPLDIKPSRLGFSVRARWELDTLKPD
ncbi:UGMP family protein [compost metagenome]